jgi:hypothetical protein
MKNNSESRKLQPSTARTDAADAVVRVSIDGLNEEAILRAFERANREALRRLEAPTRSKKLRYPITLSMLDSIGLRITDVTELCWQVDSGALQGLVFYLVGEDSQSRRVCARIELVRQVIQ